MTEQPVILNESLAGKALADPKFFALLPEYLALQVKLRTMHVDLQSQRGCTGCRKKRAVQNLFQEFLTITSVLSPDAVGRLKQYLGAPSLMFNARLPNGQVQIRKV